MAHIRGVVQRLPSQHFQDRLSKSTCQDMNGQVKVSVLSFSLAITMLLWYLGACALVREHS